MTYPEAIDFLHGIRIFGQQLGLATMRDLLQRMGNPHESLRFIHIAGTNGKGSVAAMCHAVLTQAGYRTGLYTSPHLVSFCERFQINQQPITRADLVRLVEFVQPFRVGMNPEPTLFETVTAMALQYFHEQNVDVVVWETGLGGRLDATNVVTPLVSVITNVAFDHMQHLGDSLDQIAFEKCGIIKPGVPVVTAARAPEALRVIREQCAQRGSPLTEVTAPASCEIPLFGEHQRWNCATAVRAIQCSGFVVDEAALRAGLKNTQWPGRLQIINGVVLDGAHNPAAAEVLAAAVRQRFSGQRVLLIIGVLKDKDYRHICEILAPLAARVICVPVKSERTSDPRELAQNFLGATVCANAAAALALRQPNEVTVVTGSLFLVGEALQVLQPSAASEREMVLQ